MNKQLVQLGLSLLVIGAVSACVPKAETIKTSGKPCWIDNKGNGAIGQSVTHVKGKHFQKDLAYSRAITEIATRGGVTVTNEKEILERVVNNRASAVLNSATQTKIDGIKINVELRDSWHDKANDITYVWAYPVEQLNDGLDCR